MLDRVEMTFGPGSTPTSAVYKPINYQVTGTVPGQGLVSDTGTGTGSPE